MLVQTYCFVLGSEFSHEQPRTNKPQPGQRNSQVPPLRAKTPLEGFFSKYPKFKFQPSNSPTFEFNRLCKLYKWKKGDQGWKVALEAFNISLKKEFNDLYGSDEHNIKNWRKLCYVLRIDPAPDTLRESRDVSSLFSESLRESLSLSSERAFVQAVLMKNVNLVDLVHSLKVKTPTPPKPPIFETETQLSVYTKMTGKFFPKEDARDGGVLRYLRRHILLPRDEKTRLKERKIRRDRDRSPVKII